MLVTYDITLVALWTNGLVPSEGGQHYESIVMI